MTHPVNPWNIPTPDDVFNLETNNRQPQPEQEPSALRRYIAETLQSCKNVASMMRIGGAITVVAAMSAFLLQGWDAGNDISRFYMLLTQIVLLAVGGLGLSYVLKENKGARMFFGLSLFSISAAMTTLSALIYSLVPWDGGAAYYPSYASWNAPDGAALMAATLVGVVVSAGILVLGHMIFARRSAAAFASAALAAHSLLLVPVRDSATLGFILLLAILIPAYAVRKRLAEDFTLSTPSGYFAIGSLFVPAGIMLVRTLWFYECDAMLEIMLSAVGFAGLHFITRQLQQGSGLKGMLDLVSLVLAAKIGLNLADLLDHVLSEAPTIMLSSLAFAGITSIIALRDGEVKLGYLHIAGIIFATGQAFALLASGGVSMAMVVLAISGIVFTIGRAISNPHITTYGVMVAIAALLQQLFRIVEVIDFSSWITLSILGAAAIVGASVIERHGAEIKLKLMHLKGRIYKA